MYTVTFYSFKGGVGRSMALVNVGAQLAKQGKKVLLVDFDLEAPGLTSFSMGKAHAAKPGVVEYVREYISTGIAPKASDYCYEAQVFPEGGQIWIMPSGVGDGSYSNNLNSIDWADLYEARDGYLLFEDLRNQWSTSVGADYVLVDSRTGHSDVEGICTRQLPDAVCFLFYPNEQNLEGLRRVNARVRREDLTPREGRRRIETHFVVSNVPELDDEDGILRTSLARFKEDLNYKSLAAEIHHYQSLSLLNEDVFSLTRPNSRLTREYTRLVQAIVRENLQDRDAVLTRLQQMRKELPEEARRSRGTGMNEFKSTIERVLRYFPTDPEVRLRGALAYEGIGEVQDALDLLTIETADASAAPALSHATRARLFMRKGERDKAVQSVLSMLDSEGADLRTVLESASLLSALNPQLFEHLGTSKVVQALVPAERFFLATQCEDGLSQLRAQVDILRSLLAMPPSDEPIDPGLLRRQLAVALIGLGDFEGAIAELENPQVTQLLIADQFNLAMAKWGAYGKESAVEGLTAAVELHNGSAREERSPNYLQCLAIANFVVGRVDAGRELIEQARQEMSARPRQEFSAWSYLRVNAATFKAHLKVIEELPSESGLVPEYVARRRDADKQKAPFH